jgi:histidine triad (HIT) family protein
VPAFMVIDSPDGMGFLDTRPVFKGHVLVVPRPHVTQLSDLPGELLPR